MKFSNMPAIFSLTAGLVVCISTFFSDMSMVSSLAWVFASLLIFYILGLAFRALFNVILSDGTTQVREVISEEPDIVEINETDGNQM
jgi:hypothetical protein